MFDKKAIDAIRREMPLFNLDKPCNTSLLAEVFTEYFERYGFFDTLKDFDGDYYLGQKSMAFGSTEVAVVTHFWRPLEPRGTVVVVHGLFDHVGLYQPLIRYFLEQNYSVIAMDLPGHGLSGGAPTHVELFSDYSAVLAGVMDMIPDAMLVGPLYGFGQSTGAAVIAGLVFELEKNREPLPFHRLVFFGPLIRPRRWRVGRLTLLLFGRFLKTIHREMAVQNSHDESFHHFLLHHDPLQSKRLSVSWVKALDQWIDTCQSARPLSVPLLIVQGTGDRVVDWRKNVPQFKKIFRCHQVNFIEGAMHHLANEANPWRTAIYASVGQFLKQRVVCEVKE